MMKYINKTQRIFLDLHTSAINSKNSFWEKKGGGLSYETKIAIAKEMLKQNMDIEMIVKLTGLAKKEIQRCLSNRKCF